MLMDRLNSGADFANWPWIIRGHEYGDHRRGLGYVPESALNQSDPSLKKMVVG